ncbi:hypothetical protein [Nocardia sp. NPDC004722]
MEKFSAWLDQIHDEHGEFDYRAIYSAYLRLGSGRTSEGTHASAQRMPDGSFEIRAGRATIVLADDAEREALAAYMVNRYCGDRYPSMEAWENRQHEWYVEDLTNWSSDR